jgi:thioredoxin 1
MKQLITFVLLSTLLGLSACNKNKVTKIPLPDGFIENDWNKAISTAQDNDRPIFVHFYADWCSLCADFKEEVLNDTEVEAYMLANFIGASLDSEKEPGLAIYNSFNLGGHPNLVVTDKDGNKIGEHLGKMNKVQFLEWIKTYE